MFVSAQVFISSSFNSKAVNIAISVTALKVHLLSAQCSFMMQEHREVDDLKVAAFAVTTT